MPKRRFNIDENMGVLKDGGLLSIDKLKTPTEDDEIQLYNALYRVNEYTLDIDVNGLNEITPYLQDNYTGETTPLENGLNTISFTISEDIALSIEPTRFKIIYQFEPLSIQEENIINLTMYPNPIDQGILTITSSALNGLDAEITITNLLGQQVMTQHASFSSNKAVITDLNNLSSGMYIITITNENLKVSRKIVIQ